jgi:hypothetical protein
MFLKLDDLILNTDHIHSIRIQEGGAIVVIDRPDIPMALSPGSAVEYRRLWLNREQADRLLTAFRPEPVLREGQSGTVNAVKLVDLD